MYEKGTSEQKQPEHLKFADNFCKEMVGVFTLQEQNECVEYVINTLKNDRFRQIKEMEDMLENLRQKNLELPDIAPLPSDNSL